MKQVYVLIEVVEGGPSLIVGFGKKGLKKLQEDFCGMLRGYLEDSELTESEIDEEIENAKDNWNWTDTENRGYDILIMKVSAKDIRR